MVARFLYWLDRLGLRMAPALFDNHSWHNE